nr:HNH endonuclease signature motif containing protein [Endozoicomonas sp. SESOKO4]
MLLGEDKACAITGESTQAALDAAHIIPAAKGGMEVIGNGIILRTDLHRLYDAGVFEINKDGTLTVLEKKGLSRAYKDLLATKKIKEQVISRINEALDIK